MKITKRQLRRIIKEEKDNLLKEQEANYGPDYDPLMELYDIDQHLSDAAMKLMEIADFLEGDSEHPRRAIQLDSLSRQVSKIKQTVETHVRALEGEPA